MVAPFDSILAFSFDAMEIVKSESFLEATMIHKGFDGEVPRHGFLVLPIVEVKVMVIVVKVLMVE